MIDRKLLIEKAFEAQKFCYTPYSNFNVGAALLGANGKIYQGCNIENASYGATICAERTAIFKAVSEGAERIAAIAIAGGLADSEPSDYAFPCGICRQFMKEFCDGDFKIITGDDEDSLKVYTMDEILPEGFRL